MHKMDKYLDIKYSLKIISIAQLTNIKKAKQQSVFSTNSCNSINKNGM